MLISSDTHNYQSIYLPISILKKYDCKCRNSVCFVSYLSLWTISYIDA